MIIKEPIELINYTYNALFTNSARNAWKHILKFINVKPPYKVLLPAYIGFTEREGSGVFDPVLYTKTPYEFYLLNNELSFNLIDIENTFKKGHIKIFLIIHYFGFCLNDIISLKKLCEKYHVILVEDCAHAFTYGFENLRLGQYGDVSFYSIHKFLPTQTGGILKINNQIFSLPPIPKRDQCNYKVLLQLLNSNLKSIQNKRCENYNCLYSLLDGIDEIKIMFHLNEDTIPQSFPILIKTISREKLYFNLLKKGLPTIALYYRLISEIDKNQFPISYEISNSILNLPVHQDTTKDDLEYLVKQILSEINILKK